MTTAFEEFNLTGKTALVTGGSTGLGYQMARGLARSGATVLIAARRTDLLKHAAERLMMDEHVKRVDWHPVDLTDRSSVDALAEHALSTYGGIDIFVGNAGATYVQQILDIDPHSVDECFQLNLTANMQLTKAFLPRMRERKWGRILFSSSIASTLVTPLGATATYSATKGALNAFCRVIAADMGRYNITANSLVLGYFMTDILTEAVKKMREVKGAAATDKYLDNITSVTSVGRIGDPKEIEGLVRLLASEAGSYITGTSFPIDGGMSIMRCPFPSDAEPIF